MAYFSNGSEGEILDNQCAECMLRDAPCPVYWTQMQYNYSQCGNEVAEKILNELVDTKGICKMKLVLDKYQRPPSEGPRPSISVLPSMKAWAKSRGIEV